MNLVELTEYLVKNVVENKDQVTVKQFPSEDENEVIIDENNNEFLYLIMPMRLK